MYLCIMYIFVNMHTAHKSILLILYAHTKTGRHTHTNTHTYIYTI